MAPTPTLISSWSLRWREHEKANTFWSDDMRSELGCSQAGSKRTIEMTHNWKKDKENQLEEGERWENVYSLVEHD